MFTYEVNITCDRCHNASISAPPMREIHKAIKSAEAEALRKQWQESVLGNWDCPDCIKTWEGPQT